MVGQKLFFTDRNTAVRDAEVHSLPLHFPLKKSRIWTAGTWDFWKRTGLLAPLIGERIFQMITVLAAGWRWRKRASPVARKAFNIIFNYRHYGAGIARNVAQRNGGQRCSRWPVRIIVIMLLAVAERGFTSQSYIK